MGNLAILLNLIVFVSSGPKTYFLDLLNYGTQSDISFAMENGISSWNDYFDYLETAENNDNALQKGKGDGDDGSVSDSIIDVRNHLNDIYPDYFWIRNEEQCALTSDVSNHIPIEMQSAYFPTQDIESAIVAASVENKTSYGGCGPIASLGVMDYFARYLGYDEIISDVTDSDDRVALATEVLSNTYFSIFGGQGNTLVWPWDFSSCFNTVLSNHGLSSIISATDYWSLFGGQKANYWNLIVDSVDSGIPVTMFTGMASGDGDFSQHYTNIYGYETWIGIPDNGGERLVKQFVKARLNWGRNSEYYCDADILNCGQVGIVTYEVNYSNEYSFYDYDFAEEFVNDDGGGQYFFYPINEPVHLLSGQTLQTSRLRTSYIEDQYLVLSPIRQNAGIAYLDITFPNDISVLSFTASMWSGLEGAINEDFKLQYYDTGWQDHIDIEPSNLSTLRNYPDSFRVLFPKDTRRIRFYATSSHPNGDRNKGRICLDDFTVKYH